MKERFSIIQQAGRIPFLRMLLPLMAGILLSEKIEISAGTMAAATVAAVIIMFLLRGERPKDAIIALSIFLAGVTSVKVLRPESTLPQDKRLVINCRVTDNVNTKGRWHRTTAKVEAYRLYDDSLAVWRQCNTGVSLFVDTACNIAIGERVSAVAYVNALDSTGGKSAYSRTMRSRGITGRAYVINGRLIESHYDKDISLWDRVILASRKLQRKTGEMLLSGNTPVSGDYEKEKGVAVALLTGDKSLLDSETREEYSRAGTSHILAISGLHLGIIFALLNYLLMPVVLVRRGNTLRSAVIIMILWGYAFMTGLSPSVLRSAFMLSILQLSLMTYWSYNSYNALFASAFVLLLVNPLFIYDISFQMSYLALISILFFYRRFNRLFGVSKADLLLKRSEEKHTGWRRYGLTAARKIFMFIAGTIIIALSAQIGVAPLTGYVFGRIPLLNLFINPVIMILVTAIMFLGFTCMLLPAGFAGEWFYKLLKIQNVAAEKTASFSFASIETPYFPQEALYLTYFLIFFAMILIKRIEDSMAKHA